MRSFKNNFSNLFKNLRTSRRKLAKTSLEFVKNRHFDFPRPHRSLLAPAPRVALEIFTSGCVRVLRGWGEVPLHRCSQHPQPCPSVLLTDFPPVNVGWGVGSLLLSLIKQRREALNYIECKIRHCPCPVGSQYLQICCKICLHIV